MSGPCLRTKPKFIRLYNMLNVSPPTARGLLEFLWDSVHDNGDAIIGDAEAIEAAAGWTGEPGKLCEALLTCGGKGKFGFIEEVPEQPGVYQLHDLLEHTPADRQRVWIRQQERKERGTTISEIRRAAANARWAKEKAKTDAANAGADAKSCTPMQMDAVCMPLQNCSNPSNVGQPSPKAEPAPQRQPTAITYVPDIPTFLEVKDYFRSLGFAGNTREFLNRFQEAMENPNSQAARNGWQTEAFLYACEGLKKIAAGANR